MILNTQTSLTYNTLTLALAALPSVFDQNYELVIENGIYDTSGNTTTIGKNTGVYSLMIRGESKSGVLLSSTNTLKGVLEISGSTNTKNVTIKDIRVSGSSTQTIYVNNGPSFLTFDNIDMISNLGNFFRITGPTTTDITIKNCTAETQGHVVLLMSTPSNLTFLNNNFKVNRSTTGPYRCIANGTSVSGALSIIGNTFETINGEEGVFLVLSSGSTINTIEKNTFKSCGKTQLKFNCLTGSTINNINDNLFESTVSFSVYIDNGIVSLRNNTIIKNTSQYSSVYLNNITECLRIKNNIFYSELTGTTNAWVYITFVDLDFNLSNVKSDNNLYFSPLNSRIQATPTGNVTIWEPTTALMTVGVTSYNSLSTIKTFSSDLNSLDQDPIFTLGVSGTPYYYLDVTSPAHNSANFNVTTGTTDIRGYYRQDLLTDMGAYDIDGGEFAKIPNDEYLFKGVIRRNDGATFINIQLAISSVFTKDEDVYLDVTDNTMSNWVTQPGMLAKRKMFIQPHSSINGKLIVTDTINMNLATSVSSCSNIIFKNLIFDAYRADGVTPGLCGLSLGLGTSYNLVFEDCEFKNGEHGAYLYTGQDVVFKNCKFYNFYHYGVYGANVKSIHFLGCDFDHGDFAGHPERVNSYEKDMIAFKTCKNVVFKNCSFKGSIYTQNILRLDDIDDLVVENCLFKNAEKGRPLFIQGTNGNFNNRVKVNNNIFCENGSELTGSTSLILIVASTDIEFKNNTIANNSIYYTSFLSLRENCSNITACNNFFHGLNSATGVTSMALTLSPTADRDKLIIQNNYHVTNNLLDRILTIVGQGITTTKVCIIVSNANLINLEQNSVKNTVDLDLSNYLTTGYTPHNTSLIVTGGDLSLSNNTDFLNNVKNLSMGFGAIYYDNVPYVSNFDYVMKLFNLTTDEHYPSMTPPIVVLSYDVNTLMLDSPKPDELYEMTIGEDTGLIDIVNAIDINTIDPSSSSLVCVGVIVGDYSILLDKVYSVTDILTNIRYDINYVYFDLLTNNTYVAFQQEIPSSFTFTYEKKVYYGVGFSGLLNFSERYKDYKMTLTKILSNGTSNTVTINPFIHTVQPRCKSNYILSRNIIYLGDSTTVTNLSFEDDSHFFTITGTGMNIINDTNDVITFTPTLTGNTEISLYTNNTSDIPNIKSVNGVLKVLPIPEKAILNFDTNKQILHKNEILKLCATNDINNNKKVSRFLPSTGTTFNWKIINSQTNVVFREYYGDNVDVDISDYPVTSYDIQVTMTFSDDLTICKDMLEKRYLTVLPDFVNTTKTKHFITCTKTDIGKDIDGYDRTETSIIMGDRTTDCLNSQIINPGDVIILDGDAQSVRFYNLHGTEEEPILIIANCSNGVPFNVVSKTYFGILFQRCTHFIVSGAKNYSGIDLPHSFVLETNLDPKIYSKAPGTMLMSLTSFVSDARICGIECKNSKFDCISAKMSPDPKNSSTWRNDITGGWFYNNLNIHHNYLHDSQGEGCYLGHYGAGIDGYAANSQGVYGPYWASIQKNTKVYRNLFVNNGFDAIQQGNCFIGGEIHNNIMRNSGFRQVFGQAAGIAANYIVGDIYNNDIGDGIVTFFTQGKQRIYNNIIDNANVTSPGDSIYVLGTKVDAMRKWDIDVVPQVVIDPLYNGADTVLDVFNNILNSGRNGVLINPEYGWIGKNINITNNVSFMPDVLYNTAILSASGNINWWISEINLNPNLPGHTINQSNNLTYKKSEINLLNFFDPSAGIYGIINDSLLYKSGQNLNIFFNDRTTYRDKNGFLLPSFDNKFPTGPYDFDVLNTYGDITPPTLLLKDPSQSDLTNNSVILYSSVLTNKDPQPITSYGFILSKTVVNPTLDCPDCLVFYSNGSINSLPSDYSLNITGLDNGAVYYYNSFAINLTGVGYSDSSSLTTLSQPIPITTLSCVRTFENQLVGVVSGDVTTVMTITSKGFVYSTVNSIPDLLIDNYVSVLGDVHGVYSLNIENMTEPVGSYWIRSFIISSGETYYGNVVKDTVTTQIILLPTVLTNTVSEITYNSVTCGGTVVNNGGDTSIFRGVCWGTTHNPTINNSKTINGNGEGLFLSNVNGLASDTTYYLRAYVTNDAGTSYGDEVSFTTLPVTFIPEDYFNNNIQVYDLHNTVFLGKFNNNIIKSGLENCTIGGNFKNNVINSNFKNNIISDNFKNNNIENDVTNKNFTNIIELYNKDYTHIIKPNTIIWIDEYGDTNILKY